MAGLMSTLLEEQRLKDAPAADAQARAARSGDRKGPVAAAAAREAARQKTAGSVGKGPATVPQAEVEAPPVPATPVASEASQAADARRAAVGGRMGVNRRGSTAEGIANAGSAAVNAGLTAYDIASRRTEARMAQEARDAAAKKLRGSTGSARRGSSPPPSERGGSSNNRVVGRNTASAADKGSSAGKATTTSDKPSGYKATPRSKPSQSAAPQAKGTAEKAKKAAASTPQKAAKRKGSAGEASNRDLPGRSKITYSNGKVWDSTKDKGPAPLPGKGGKKLGPPRKIHPDTPAKRPSVGPGGGAESVLRASRGVTRLSRLQNREK